jgi:acyl-CoA reductase-like NAD-dependent aldehyde dehydrogenase
MRAALLLVDCQNDFLSSPGLEPSAGTVTEQAAALLAGFREHAMPVIHVWTTVQRDPDTRMPHWRRSGKWACVEGTAGHAPPESLAPRPGEPIVHKSFFSAFSTGELDRRLAEVGPRVLVIAGLHLHACVRETVLDAYQRGFEVIVAEDAVASDDPLHAVLARRWLEARAAVFRPVSAILTGLEGEAPATIVDTVRVGEEVKAARRGFLEAQELTVADRTELLARLGAMLAAEAEPLARQMAVEVGKPVTLGRGEVARSIALLEAAAAQAAMEESQDNRGYRRRPLGVVAAITPWNNPLAIPIGKIAPAVAFGNTVVWKPAPAGTGVAYRVRELMARAGWPADWVRLVTGGREIVERLVDETDVDAVTLSGSPAAGRTVAALCARRLLPLQAELGGNNAAIVQPDCDLEDAARRVVDGAFAFAGQRCTANRRVIVDAAVYDSFLDLLQAATAAFPWGDPFAEGTRMGPLISAESRERVAAVIERAVAAGAKALTPWTGQPPGIEGAWHPPVIMTCDDPGAEIIQEEAFGPVLVVQKAEGWEHALDLLNGVRQGLAAALFSRSEERRRDFLARARAGILKIGETTADAAADLPFGGWKASGFGPPEHGPGNRDFYTRFQAVYQRAS